ncbi:hypothetical protein MUP95_08080 [bacterium]|nr:hypothetical protein [bacterium]
MISGIFFMAAGFSRFIIDYEKLGSIERAIVIFQFTYGIFFLFYGFMSTSLYLKLNMDDLIIKWDNKLKRQVIQIKEIDSIILNDWNFELKLNNGLSKKFSCGNLKYKQVKDVKAFLEEHFSEKIKYRE